MKTQFLWKRFFVIVAVMMLVGLAWMVSESGFHKDWEMISRREGVHRLARALSDFREQTKHDPRSLHELCVEMGESHGGELRWILWPRWAHKYRGEPPVGWDPANEKDSLMSVYELMPADENVIVMEKADVARKGRRLGVSRETLEVCGVP